MSKSCSEYIGKCLKRRQCGDICAIPPNEDTKYCEKSPLKEKKYFGIIFGIVDNCKQKQVIEKNRANRRGFFVAVCG